MATTFKNMLHPLQHHRDKKEPSHSGPLHDRTDSAMDRPREEEKHQLAQWEAQKHTLTPDDIDIDPQKKPVGHSSKVLREEDFELIKTLGTGPHTCTCARPDNRTLTPSQEPLRASGSCD